MKDKKIVNQDFSNGYKLACDDIVNELLQQIKENEAQIPLFRAKINYLKTLIRIIGLIKINEHT